ncbi:MAG: hypothetical protein AABX28_03705 [Nanoarchaeota archaeon]
MVKSLKRWSGKITTLQVGDEKYVGEVVKFDYRPNLNSPFQPGYFFQFYEGERDRIKIKSRQVVAENGGLVLKI